MVPTNKDAAKRRIQQLIDLYNGLSADEKRELTEANVVRQFIDPLLEALGWPIGDPRHYHYEFSTLAGRPDIMLALDSGERLFVEAKRFGRIDELAISRTTLSGMVTPGQMTLPGMATDRTAEEQQAINYAFKNDGKWAILTNFERLRLFNARRDWLVLSFDKPQAFISEFDQLWQLSYENVIAGGLEQLSNQRVRADVDTDYLNFINTWRQRLAQDILDRPDANPWAFTAGGAIRLDELRAVVQRVLDRLVVIRFAEDHLIARPGSLNRHVQLRREDPYTFPLSVTFRQIFRRFDDLHNSALFAPHPADQADFSDTVLEGLVAKLYEARYRAMTPDIMGNTYEQYLGTALVLDNGKVGTRDNLETRKKQGSYYTPQVIVRFIVDNSLGRYLYGTANGQPDGEPLDNESRKTWQEIADLRIIDPACGSGSFLIYAYEVLAGFYRSEIKRVTQARADHYDELVAGGMTAPFDLQLALTPFKAALDALNGYPRLILERHLYGVDLDPQAAEIATVNLIMRAMADQRTGNKRLPLILNQNVKVGNALIGAGPDDVRYAEHADALATLRRLRLALVNDDDNADHDAQLAQVTQLTETLNAALNAELAPYFVELTTENEAWTETIRPMHWAVAFPELFVDVDGKSLGDAGGFTVVIGNPPWEIVKPDLREYYAQFDDLIESKLTRKQVEARIDELNAADPRLEASWERQKARVLATSTWFKRSDAYTRQGRGDTATHKLFTERGYTLLQHAGRLGYVVPSGIYSDLGTKELRGMLLNEGEIEHLYNFSNEKFFFSDVHHSFKFTLLGAQKGVASNGFWATFRFNPRVAVHPLDLKEFLANSDNLVWIKRRSLERFSPDSLSVMEFSSQRDYDISDAIYGDLPLLGETSELTWNVNLSNEFHMTNNRHLFNTSGGAIAVYNGRMIHQFDSAYAPHEFWIEHGKVSEIRENIATQIRNFRVSFRRIARTTDSRTLIACVVQPNTICDTVAVICDDELAHSRTPLFLCSVFNSFCLDYILRQKIATTVNMFYMYQLPMPRLTAGNAFFDAIVPRAAALTCTTAAFADLWQDVMGTPWVDPATAEKPGFSEKPGFWPTTDPDERQRLRDELDAIVAHVYGLSRADFAHILGTFPLVFPDTPEGDAKKERLLATYDAFAFMRSER